MNIRPLILILPFFLMSCAYTTERSIQEVRVETPGTHGAVCFVEVDGLRHVVNAPDTITIAKHQDNLHVKCRAPGNRDREVVIKPVVTTSTFFAGPLLPISYPWDYVSGAMYKYPDVVSVDFTYMAARDADLPAHNNPDVKQPEEYDREEYLPSKPVLNSDKYEAQEYALKRKEYDDEDYGFFDEEYSDDYADDEGSPFPNTTADDGGALGKGDVPAESSFSDVLDGVLAPEAGGASDDSAPVVLYPGEYMRPILLCSALLL